jgi:hypothetical protein
MSSRPLGSSTSEVEVTNISTHGVWLLAGDKELFMSYDDFHVEEPTPGHFYWPELDVDVGIETIEHPDRFPLKAK